MPDENIPNDPPAGNVPFFAANEKIAKINVAEEIKNSFLDYSMSVIISRALPDVRDGLKPSQRRILYAMHELGLYAPRKHMKCAKICGDTSGNYHPHGEAVIYPTLVHMAQPWVMRERPCPFLKDKRCAVYEHRPASCRGYPYLDRPEFTARTLGMIGRLSECPVVGEVWENLKQATRFRSRSTRRNR